jgi:hypothetical protein
MANDVVPVSTPANLGQGSHSPKPVTATVASGNSLPPGGKGSGALEATANQASHPVGTPARTSKQATPPATTTNKANLPQLVTQLNKYLNDSGRPNQFRVDPTSGGKTIQEINPASGEVIGEYSVAQFPELARSLGVSGVLVDSRA